LGRRVKKKKNIEGKQKDARAFVTKRKGKGEKREGTRVTLKRVDRKRPGVLETGRPNSGHK